MNTTTKPKTPPNRVLYATMGLLLALLLVGAGGFLWLSGKGGNSPISIGGPFALEDGNGKPVTDQGFAANICWCISAIRFVQMFARQR